MPSTTRNVGISARAVPKFGDRSMALAAGIESPSGRRCIRYRESLLPVCTEFSDCRRTTRFMRSLMRIELIAAILAALFQSTLASAQTIEAVDPVIGIDRPFGLGGRACKQYDDTGRLYIYSEGLPDLSVISWLQQSDNGTKPNVPMPEELAQALPLIPGCMPGKHHAPPANR